MHIATVYGLIDDDDDDDDRRVGKLFAQAVRAVCVSSNKPPLSRTVLALGSQTSIDSYTWDGWDARHETSA